MAKARELVEQGAALPAYSAEMRQEIRVDMEHTMKTEGDVNLNGDDAFDVMVTVDALGSKNVYFAKLFKGDMYVLSPSPTDAWSGPALWKSVPEDQLEGAAIDIGWQDYAELLLGSHGAGAIRKSREWESSEAALILSGEIKTSATAERLPKMHAKLTEMGVREFKCEIEFDDRGRPLRFTQSMVGKEDITVFTTVSFTKFGPPIEVEDPAIDNEYLVDQPSRSEPTATSGG